MNISLKNNSHRKGSTLSLPNEIDCSPIRQLPRWATGILLTAAIICSGCGDASGQIEASVSEPLPVSESQTVSTTVAASQQAAELPAPATQEADSPGLLSKAGKMLSDAKKAGGQQAADTGQWLKGAWDGAAESGSQAADGTLDWANKTFKSLKDQGLTTASSTGQWLSDDWQNMESWQYKVFPANSVPPEELENKLNELGKQGWECFSVDDQRMIFKKASDSYLRRLPFKDILRLAPLLNQLNQ